MRDATRGIIDCPFRAIRSKVGVGAHESDETSHEVLLLAYVGGAPSPSSVVDQSAVSPWPPHHWQGVMCCHLCIINQQLMKVTVDPNCVMRIAHLISREDTIIVKGSIIELRKTRSVKMIRQIQKGNEKSIGRFECEISLIQTKWLQGNT